MIDGDDPVKRKKRGGKRIISRVAGVALALLALMVWMAEDDREKLADSTIGTQIPLTDPAVTTSDIPSTTPSASEPLPGDDPAIEYDALGNPIKPADAFPSSPTGSTTTPAPKPSTGTTKPSKATPGVLDPTLLPPDTYSSMTVRSNTVVMSYIDTENFENPNVRYEVRVYSKAGLKIVNTKETNLIVKGVSKTNCRIEVRSLLNGRHSNPLKFGCNATG